MEPSGWFQRDLECSRRICLAGVRGEDSTEAGYLHVIQVKIPLVVFYCPWVWFAHLVN
jgi:hypothetical protein